MRVPAPEADAISAWEPPPSFGNEWPRSIPIAAVANMSNYGSAKRIGNTRFHNGQIGNTYYYGSANRIGRAWFYNGQVGNRSYYGSSWSW